MLRDLTNEQFTNVAVIGDHSVLNFPCRCCGAYRALSCILDMQLAIMYSMTLEAIAG